MKSSALLSWLRRWCNTLKEQRRYCCSRRVLANKRKPQWACCSRTTSASHAYLLYPSHGNNFVLEVWFTDAVPSSTCQGNQYLGFSSRSLGDILISKFLQCAGSWPFYIMTAALSAKETASWQRPWPSGKPSKVDAAYTVTHMLYSHGTHSCVFTVYRQRPSNTWRCTLFGLCLKGKCAVVWPENAYKKITNELILCKAEHRSLTFTTVLR